MNVSFLACDNMAVVQEPLKLYKNNYFHVFYHIISTIITINDVLKKLYCNKN